MTLTYKHVMVTLCLATILAHLFYSEIYPRLLSYRVNPLLGLQATNISAWNVDLLPSAIINTSSRTVNAWKALGDSNFPYEDPFSEGTYSENVNIFVDKPKNVHKRSSHDPPLKKILFWNEVFGNRYFYFGFGREAFLRAGCRVNTCTVTADRSRFPLRDLDAVLFHFRSGDASFPTERSAHTRYVFWLLEPPPHFFRDPNPYKNVFNWTITYRLDSDFPLPYGRVFRRRTPLAPLDRNYAAGKTKMAAWFVSNCNPISGRTQLVNTLRKWIQVDQYGHCGKRKCERKTARKCYKMVSDDYKFYFSFENSLCQDYVTEKFFNILRLETVPVVYGLANYAQHAPPHSYIDALSFPSAKALADHLIYLNNNDTAYNEYFRWKRYHWVPNFFSTTARTYCDLCERLHTDNTTKMYDLKNWFLDGSHCKTRYDKDISAFINGNISGYVPLQDHQR
nr:alpha-(1,3)-fucosyltransferase C-like [Procambarus clarkii]XP_045610431.1 alpha-(1,3)-fucosyltransferase C-like [Procambarus clarkii]